MVLKSARSIFALGLAALAISTAPARADAIDGEWCSKDGKHLSIEGSRIVTPAGTEATGLYDRHAFTYTVPDSDPGAGTTVFMTQVNDQSIRLTAGNEAGTPVETWMRCDVTS